jgi:hypothetical protein
MDMKTICRNQVEEAKKHKWIMGQKLGYDPGEKAIVDWVTKYAKQYRDEFNVCFENMVNKVAEQSKAKLKERFPMMLDSDIHDFVSIIVEEFTLEWTKECAMNDGDKHLKEI